MEIIDERNKKNYLFPCSRWLSKDKDDKSLVRELPCINRQPSLGTITSELNFSEKTRCLSCNILYQWLEEHFSLSVCRFKVAVHVKLYGRNPNKAVSQITTLWCVTGKSNGSQVWFSFSHNCTLASGAVLYSVCQV